MFVVYADPTDKESDEEKTREGKKGTTSKRVGGQEHLKVLIRKRLHTVQKNLDTNQPFTIFRAPAFLCEKAKYMYEPEMVSIGPYHNGKERLRTMEEHKWRFLYDFLERNSTIGVEEYLEEMRARRCYSESIKTDSDSFALMLLLDGCFILEGYMKCMNGYSDILVNSGWSTIDTDLILLENQVPFFVIHKLASLADPSIHQNCGDQCRLLNFIFQFLPNVEWLSMPAIACDKVDHLLHFYYECMVPEFHNEPSNSHSRQPLSMKSKCLSWLRSRLPSIANAKQQSERNVFPCATVLHESGVTFVRKKNPHGMFDITFDDGIMEMPLLSMDDRTKVIFANLRSFEQSCDSSKRTFTSFLTLMDFLIDSGNDVTLLKKYGIIETMVETDEEVATLVNGVSEGNQLDFRSHHFAGLFKQVYEYSNSTWPKYRARLKHDYFSNPWTTVSVLAGVTLLGLSATQTYYTVYSAYHE